MSKDDQIASLNLQVSQLMVALEAAMVEITELKERLNKNSRNSDKPPSSDGLTKKPAIPRKRGHRKPGGQPGHPGNTLKASANPNHTKFHPVLQHHCPCGCSLDKVLADQNHWDCRQVFDLPPTLLEVTEHRLERKICPDCDQEHFGNFPEQVNAPVQYGERVRALAVLLNVEQSLPLARVQEVFASLTGQAINESTIHSAVKRTYEELATEEAIIHEALLNSEVAHADETGGRIAGKLHWIHGFGSLLHTFFRVYDQRGGSVINGKKSHLSTFNGWLVHDCLNSYMVMGSEVKHSLCNAHLLRELTALMEAKDACRWPEQMHNLIMAYYQASDKGRDVVNPTELEKLNIQYDAILSLADKEEPPPKQGRRGRPKKSKGRNLYDRFKNWREAVLAFADHKEVPFTNNLGERDLRPWKTKLKVSGCFRTVEGAERYARIKAFCSTAKKHGKVVFDQLVAIQSGNSFLRLT